jgi:hypothetical protein
MEARKFDIVSGKDLIGRTVNFWTAPLLRRQARETSSKLIEQGGFVEYGEEQIRDLARCWQVLDDDGDGLLSIEGQIQAMVEAAGLLPSPGLIEAMVNASQPQWRGHAVDFDAFLNAVELQSCTEPVREADLRDLAALGCEPIYLSSPTPLASGRAPKAPVGGISWQQARGSDFGNRFLERSPPAEAESVPPSAVAAHQLRRLLRVPLGRTPDGVLPSTLNDIDVDDVFRPLSILSEKDRVVLIDFLTAASKGITRVLPEDLEARYPHELLQQLFSFAVGDEDAIARKHRAAASAVAAMQPPSEDLPPPPPPPPAP